MPSGPDLGVVFIYGDPGSGGSYFGGSPGYSGGGGGGSYGGGETGQGSAPAQPPGPDLGTVVVSAPKPPPPPSAPIPRGVLVSSGASLPFGVGGAAPAPARPPPRRPAPRRTKPKPSRTRPQRPTRRSPAEPGPKYIPKKVPVLPRVLRTIIKGGGRLLGGIALLLHSEPAGPDDEYPGQLPMFPGFEPDRKPEPPPLVTVEVRARLPDPVSDFGTFYLPVTREPGRVASPVSPGIAPVVAPLGDTPAVQPGPQPTPRRKPTPRPKPQRMPRPAASPSPLSDVYFSQPLLNPTPRPTEAPQFNPFPEAQPIPQPRPRPQPTPSPKPNPKPLTAVNPFPVSSPQPNQDKCKCPKPKKRKERKQRSECHKGTYVETATGLIKNPSETISCQ